MPGFRKARAAAATVLYQGPASAGPKSGAFDAGFSPCRMVVMDAPRACGRHSFVSGPGFSRADIRCTFRTRNEGRLAIQGSSPGSNKSSKCPVGTMIKNTRIFAFFYGMNPILKQNTRLAKERTQSNPIIPTCVFSSGCKNDSNASRLL